MVAKVGGARSFQIRDGAWMTAGRSREDEQAALNRGQVRCRFIKSCGGGRGELNTGEGCLWRGFSWVDQGVQHSSAYLGLGCEYPFPGAF